MLLPSPIPNYIHNPFHPLSGPRIALLCSLSPSCTKTKKVSLWCSIALKFVSLTRSIQQIIKKAYFYFIFANSDNN